MDKVERARIIAVKLEEVLTEEQNRKYDRKIEEGEAVLKDKALNKLFTQYEANRKALQTMQKQLNDAVDAFNEENFGKEKPRIRIRLHAPSNSLGYDSSMTVEILTYRGRYMETTERPNPVQIAHGEVVTVLTQNRNTDNPRIQKIVDEAFHLLLEDDTDRMQKFLNL